MIVMMVVTLTVHTNLNAKTLLYKRYKILHTV